MKLSLSSTKVKVLLVTVLLSSFADIALCASSEANLEVDSEDFVFTQPLYHAVVRERAVAPMVESDVMMGMWLTQATQDVQFKVVAGSERFQVRKQVFGNFVFLGLQTLSVTESQSVQIRAKSSRFNMVTFCTVQLQVKDVNDFQPLFPPLPYSITIPEDTKVGSTITYVKATDSDSDPENTRFYYSLPQLTSDYFAVHPTTGAVVLTAPLNAKSQSVHSVAIQATDRKAALAGTALPKTTILTVSVQTVNANSPMIAVHDPASLNISQADDTSGLMLYAIVKVSDVDLGEKGQALTLRIIHCNDPGLAAIQPRRKANEYNLLLTRKPLIHGVINATIEATDNGQPPRSTRAVININLFDKNNLVPAFLNSAVNVTVSEISPIYTQVAFARARVANSNNQYGISYVIVRGNEEGFFEINPNTSLITVKKSLKQRGMTNFQLKVCATNVEAMDSNAKSYSIITVRIEDANDHDPVFIKNNFVVNVSEAALVGSELIKVEAFDGDVGLNGSIIYSLVDSAELPFEINPFNGSIFTTGLLDADILTTAAYKLRVRAHDRGSPFSRRSESLVTVNVINVNDNAPLFNEIDCVVSIPILTSEGSRLIQLNPIDLDRDLVTCSLISESKWFLIDPRTCVIRLATSVSELRIGDRLFLDVSASDGELTSTTSRIQFKLVESGEVDKDCHDTGAFRHYEETMNNLRLRHSRDSEITRLIFNSTSLLPNKYKPSVYPRSAVMDISVLEDTLTGSPVTRIRAFDRDKGYNGKLWYTIISGNECSCFSINTQTGLMSLALPLDRERQSLYNLIISVSDLGMPAKSTNVRARFTVLDVNDNSPVFERKSYSFEIPENTLAGYRFQSRIKATDKDEGENAKIRYKFSTPVQSSSFFINPITGYINATSPLDRETVSSYNLTVIATDGSTTRPLSSSVTVLIRLLDINDNAPRFYQDLHRIRISEDLPVHAVIFWLQAFDPDDGRNGLIRYSLTDGASNANDYGGPRFRVDDRTGAIRLSTPLNARTQNRYNITARARDAEKRYSTCFIVIDVLPVNRNLRPPYFISRKVKLEVKENVAIATRVGSVSAIDEDVTEPENDVRYYVTDGNGLGVFKIDENTGIITNQKGLDRESEQYYWLTIVAEDRAPSPLSSHVYVLIEVTDVNDNPPIAELPLYKFKILENSPFESEVGQIHAHDLDSGSSGEFSFRMPKNGRFKIESATGVIRTKRRLDREDVDANQDASFDVRITDTGYPPLSFVVRVMITVTDTNDNAPMFSSSLKRKISLPQRNRSVKPQPITRVVAWDNDAGSNGTVEYVLNSTQKFIINSTTGVISSAHGFHQGQRGVLKIIAFDHGDPRQSSKFRQEIEWSSPPQFTLHAPAFREEYSEEMYFEHVGVRYISEKSPLGRVIQLLDAQDIDSEQIWYRIVGGNDNDMFAISHDGALYVAGDPDAEIQDLYNLTIEATDGYNRAFKEVIVRIDDTNDHPPTFTNRTFSAVIGENLNINSHVIRLSATDDDLTAKNRNFIFRIRSELSPSNADTFHITPSGDIYTSVRLDRERQREYLLIVEVDDQGVPGSLQDFCFVRIIVRDENEHAPEFSSSVYSGRVSIREAESEMGVDETGADVILQVQAVDRDHGKNAKITYTFGAGNDDDLWKIDSVSGEIISTRRLHMTSVANGIQRSSLTVKATDGGREPLFSTAQVHIDIVRRNDVTPQFEVQNMTLSIPEDSSPESFVTKVTARAPSSVTYDIISGNIGQKFFINPHSGVILLVESLDRETEPIYNLTVACTGFEGEKSHAHVIIHVTDVNDNRPVFVLSSLMGFVTELSGLYVPIHVLTEDHQPLTLRAIDSDSDQNARVIYKIVSGQKEVTSRFSIDRFSGVISYKPDEMTDGSRSNNTYQFKVQALDLGNPRLSSENFAVVTVHVRKPKDFAPTFSQLYYNFTLYLPTVEGAIVSRNIRAVENRHQQSVYLTFSIIDGNTNLAFKINPQNGDLSVADPSMLLAGSQYNLRIRISNVNSFSDSRVAISLLNLPQTSALTFTQDVYEARILENSNKMHKLCVVSVAETTIEENFRFTILNPSPEFQIDFTTGVVGSTGVTVDRESTPIFKVLVEAVDVSKPGEGDVPRGRCLVHVIVDDVNDNPPQFTESSYHAIVQRSAKPGTMVLKVRAFDIDFGSNGVVEYSLEGDSSELFDVDAQTGVVTLRRIPDVGVDDANSEFNITIMARDMGEPPNRNHAALFLSFVNETTPIFTQIFYENIFVLENAQPFTVVTNAVKASSSENSEIFYTIEDGDEYKMFDIDYRDGTIITLGKVDREQKNLYRLRIRARSAESNVFADAEVEIRVKDENDNLPIFSEQHYTATLLESVGERSFVIQVKATDADTGENGRVEYTIVDAYSDGKHFYIDGESGVIWTARKLDAEIQVLFNFAVRANDFGQPLRHNDVMVSVKIDDVNDNSPVFEKDLFQFEMRTLSSPGNFVGKVSAWDPDISDNNMLRYSIQETAFLTALDIDSRTGVVVLKKAVDPMVSSLRYNVSVSDGIFTAQSEILVQFTSTDRGSSMITFVRTFYNFTASENQPENTEVGRISATGSGPLNYVIATETSLSDLFRISSLTGIITTTQEIDRELVEKLLGNNETVIGLQIIATDAKGTSAMVDVDIKIIDENDNAPMFGRRRYVAVFVPSETRIGDHVINVTAKDLDVGDNGRVSYHWEDIHNNAKDFFNLNENTGQIRVSRSLESLTSTASLQFFIEARDHGAIPQNNFVSLSIYFAENSNAIPTFEDNFQSILINENTPVGFEVAIVYATVAKGSIRYALSEPYFPDDVTQGGNTTLGSVIYPFAIDSLSGCITTTTPLDREAHPTYYLTVFAYIEATPELISSSQIVVDLIDENDNSPEFDVDTYRVPVLENSMVSINLLKVRAVDKDQAAFGTVTYSLKESDIDIRRKFAINSESGQLRLIAKLDREQKPRYDLLVTATDGGEEKGVNKPRTSSCQVVVNVIDVNDNAPMFSQEDYEMTISESAPLNHVTSGSNFIHVTDVDDVGASSLSVYIIDGNQDGNFRIKWNQSLENRNALQVGLQLVRPLDRETKSVYEVTLLATDDLHNSTTRVRILVGDVNDNPPFCQQLSYYGRVSEGCPLRSFILRVHAEDPDAGEHGRIVYTLSGQRSDRFDLDPHSGQLYTAAMLDREDQTEYHFVATSSDRIGQSCVSQIYIVIDDVNDNPPLFDLSSLNAAPRENLPANSVLHRVVAHDPDRGENGSFVFSLSDNENGQFYIEPEAGLVILMKQLDREDVSSYDISIQVTDQGGDQQLTSSATLHIQVLDVNDNPPIFDKARYKIKVKENASLGHVIGRVSARSLDIGANARLSYSIIRGNEHNKFAVDSETGEVTVATKLDYETDQSYVLKLAASDMSDHPLTSECTMIVDVVDVNDNPPAFASPFYQVSLSEDIPIGYAFLTLFASDQDSRDAGNVTYSLDTTDSLFSVDGRTGKLSISHPGLDYEKKRSHIISVIAHDSGIPPLSARTSVNLTVIDVNDNRPMLNVRASPDGIIDPAACSLDGANCTFYVHESEPDSMERGIVVLTAVDADGDGNGSPFLFSIKSGNKADLFYIDDDNVLKSKKPLTLNDLPDNIRSNPERRKNLVHRLRIEAEDSGSPLRLSSDPDLQLNIVVIKESLYPPRMTPHEIQIVLSPDFEEFSADVITHRLHATDRDFYDRDRIRFSLSSPSDFERFVIDPLSGAISATVPLPVGSHSISVRVSDGSRISLSSVSVTVTQINQQATENSVSIYFFGLNLEDYLSLYHLRFIKKLQTLLPEGFVERRDLLVMSLQANGNSTELLFGVRKPPTSSSTSGRVFYLSKALKNILQTNRFLIQEELGVQIGSIEGRECAVQQCAHGKCIQDPTFLPNLEGNPVPISTDSFSLVTPSFKRIKKCKCPLGTAGDSCESICSSRNSPCPRGQRCIQDQSESLGYRCDPPNRSNSILSFTGQSRIQFSLVGKARNHPFRISLRLRTFQSNATVFYATGTGQFAKLETYMGYLKYSFDCGNGPQSMIQNLKRLNDGRWSDVDITASPSDSCRYKLTLDEKYIATVESPGGKSKLNLSEITFGGQPFGSRSKRNVYGSRQERAASSSNLGINFGFRGCLQNAQINGLSATSNSKSGIQVKRKTAVSNKCPSSLIDMGACSSQPCHNSGRCLPLSDGSHECECPLTYDGDSCERLNLCGTIPCQNKGYCSADANEVQCHCADGFAGKRCEISIACQAIEKCHNGGNCTTDQNGQPSCLCGQGWTGQHCEIDVDECATRAGWDRCGGQEKCFNYGGGYACNCLESASESKDDECKLVLGLLEQPSSSNDDHPHFIIIIAASCLGAILIAAIITTVVCVRRKKKQKNVRRYRGGSRRSEDIAPVEHFSSSRYRPNQLLPPQVPRRPSDYQRSPTDHLDPFNIGIQQEQRSPLVGLVHPQIPMATFSSSATPSDNGSVWKTSSLQQEYDRSRVPSSSSIHRLPPSRSRSTSSFVDQQGFLWDIVERRPSGSAILTPSVASVPHQFDSGACGKRSDAPSSPESHRSFMSSVSARRGHLSQRSDALPGHYNTGKKRRQKQLLQMIALKEKNEQENLQIQKVLTQLVSQELQDDYYYNLDSRNSSMRSTLSRYHSSIRRQDLATGATSSLVSSYSQAGGNGRSEDRRKMSDSHPRHFSENASHSLGSSSDKTPNSESTPTSGIGLPPPPDDYELQALKEEDEGAVHGASLQLSRNTASSYAPVHNQSVLKNPPSTSIRPQVYPDSYQENYHPEASPSPPGHINVRNAPYFDIHKDNSSADPLMNAAPPDRHHSEHLPMSSLSEEEEDAHTQRRMKSKKIKVQNKRMKRKLRQHRKPDDVMSPEQNMTLLPVFDDANS